MEGQSRDRKVGGEPVIPDIIDEAVIIATAAVKMRAKNAIILRTLRDRASYDDAWYLASIIEALEALAREKEDDAERIAKAIIKAGKRRGRGRHPSDFRFADVPTLILREATLKGLAARLRILVEDSGAVRDLLDSARASALDEITEGGRRVLPVNIPAALPALERAGAIEQLRRDLLDAAEEFGERGRK